MKTHAVTRIALVMWLNVGGVRVRVPLWPGGYHQPMR